MYWERLKTYFTTWNLLSWVLECFLLITEESLHFEVTVVVIWLYVNKTEVELNVWVCSPTAEVFLRKWGENFARLGILSNISSSRHPARTITGNKTRWKPEIEPGCLLKYVWASTAKCKIHRNKIQKNHNSYFCYFTTSLCVMILWHYLLFKDPCPLFWQQCFSLW